MFERGLKSQIQQLTRSYKAQQTKSEDEVWKQIDELVDVNKHQLAIQVEDGMGTKEKVTVAQASFLEVKQQKEEKKRKLSKKCEMINDVLDKIEKDKVRFEISK